jgi:hypothetical protein
MSEENDGLNYEDIQLVGPVAVWEMHANGIVSGTYTGTFKFRCYLTPLQKIAAGREQRALLGESRAWVETPDYEHEAWLSYALTQLKHRIISAPPFWTSAGVSKSHDGDIPDENVLETVLDAAIRSELKYKKHLKQLKDDALVKANIGAKAVEEKIKESKDDGEPAEGPE